MRNHLTINILSPFRANISQATKQTPICLNIISVFQSLRTSNCDRFFLKKSTENQCILFLVESFCFTQICDKRDQSGQKWSFYLFLKIRSLDFSDDFHRGRRPSAWGISKNYCQENILIFGVVNSKWDSETQLTTAISRNVEHKIFEVGARDRLRDKNM